MIEHILEHLSDGEFHSGTELARDCGVSRTAIWQRVRELEELGVPVHRVRGRGYRIPKGLDLLDADTLAAQISPTARSRFGSPQVYLRTSSTNDRALDAVGRGENSFLCFAEHQDAGRGRRGRGWASPFAANIYLSLLQRFSGGAGSVEGLSLAVGLAVARLLVDLGVAGVALKWPNDVLVGGRKVAGVLIEISGDLAGDFHAVIGVGLNVRMAERTVVIDQPWTDLTSHLSEPPSRNALAAQLVNNLAAILAEFHLDGFPGMRDQWQAFDHMAGREVVLMTGDKPVHGVCEGVDARGGIAIRREDGVQYFYGGEVSLREQSP